MLYLYDAKTNHKRETTYEELTKLSGISKKSLQVKKTRRLKIKAFDAYLIDDKTPHKIIRDLYSKQNFEKEIFRVVEGFSDVYSVSNFGRVKRRLKDGTEKFVLPIFHKAGKYYFVNLSRDGNKESLRVATIVAKHFIGERPPGYKVTHKNGLCYENYAQNLQYTSPEKFFGKVVSKKGRAIVVLKAQTMEVVGEYKNSKDAERKLFIDSSGIRKHCKASSVSRDGLLFMFLDDYEKRYGVII